MTQQTSHQFALGAKSDAGQAFIDSVASRRRPNSFRLDDAEVIEDAEVVEDAEVIEDAEVVEDAEVIEDADARLMLIPVRSGAPLEKRHTESEERPVTVGFGYVHETTIDRCQTPDDLALIAALSLHTGSGMRVPYEALDDWTTILGMSTHRTYAALDRLDVSKVIRRSEKGVVIATSQRALDEQAAGRGTTRYALVTGPTLAATALSTGTSRTAPARNVAVLVALLAYRNAHTGCATVGSAKLQQDTGLRNSAFWTALKELERAGLVEREARYRRKWDARGRAHSYRGPSTYLTHAIYTKEQAQAAGFGVLTGRHFRQVAEAAEQVQAERHRRRTRDG